jgi:hypothetical protein
MSIIPTEIAQVHGVLVTEVTWLHGRWICYRQLFAESQRRFDLLNECASTFFFIVQDALFGEVQIMLSKLTDPAKTNQHENLSLEQLQVRLELHGDSGLAQRNRAALDALKVMCEPFRTWRNKQLAHLDLLTSMKSGPAPLPGISRQMIEDALAAVRQYLNAIEQHYDDTENGYEHFVMSSDGDALLAVLRAGLRYEELVQAGQIPLDDYRQGAWSDA